MKLKLSACVWPFQWMPPYEDAVRRIAELGYGGAEIIAWNRKTLDEYYTRAEIKKLKDLFGSLGLEIAGLHGITSGMASLKKEKRAEAVGFFERQVEVASELGTKTVLNVAHWPWQDDSKYPWPNIKGRPLAQIFQANVPYDLNWTKIFSDYVDALSQCAEAAEKAGLRYALEPHPFMTVSNSDAMLRLLDHVKSKAFGMNFDPSHLFPCGEIPHLTILKLRGRIYHCHFSDNDATSNVHWRPGKGKIDWESVLRALKETNFDGYISVELEDVPDVSTHAQQGVAGPLLDEEYILSREYLQALAQEVGIEVP